MGEIEKSSLPILVIGFGEVGRAFADRIMRSGSQVVIVDPAKAGLYDGLRVYESQLDVDDGRFSMALAAVTSGAAISVAQEFASCNPNTPYIDLSSSSRGKMREVADFFADPAEFVDGAIMGSVTLQGAAAPIFLSGERASAAGARLLEMGFEAQAMPNSRPGDASALKLLRSVITKGLEAVAVECFLAAEEFGLVDPLQESLKGISRQPFPDFLDAIVRSHVVHAARRSQEVSAAIAQLDEIGHECSVTRSVLVRFEKTIERTGNRSGDQVPENLGSALQHLRTSRQR